MNKLTVSIFTMVVLSFGAGIDWSRRSDVGEISKTDLGGAVDQRCGQRHADADGRRILLD